MGSELKQCSTPGCFECFFSEETTQLQFCAKCREEHSYRVLLIQVEHNQYIRDVLLDSRIFNTVFGMADYIGVSFVTVYCWIKRYFGMSFQEFKKEYICKSDKCYLLDISSSPYRRSDYALRKIKDRRYCACMSEQGDNTMMTNAPMQVVLGILGDKVKTLDMAYKKPVKVFPVYYLPVEPVFLEKASSPIYS